jgi:hypothetical protein
VRVTVALAALVLALPACGKRGDPVAPASKTPLPPSDFVLAQRGDVLELTFKAPQATAGGLPLTTLEVEVLKATRDGDFDDVALRERRALAPGAPVTESSPLPELGTPLRVAVRTLANGRRSPFAGPIALTVESPPPPPTAVTAEISEGTVQLKWTAPPGWTPPTPPPSASPSPGASPGTGAASPSPSPTPTPLALPSPPEDKGGGRRGGRGGPGAKAEIAGGKPAGAPFTPGFLVYRKAGEGPWTLVTPAPLTTTEYRDPQPPADPALCYVVRQAVSGIPLIESVSSAPACVSRPAPAASPSPGATP